MLRPFTFHEPRTVHEACALLRRYGDEAACYAGGTELLLAMKEGLTHFSHLVNVKTIPGLDTITVQDRVLYVGATATHRVIERSPIVREHAPLLAAVTARVANVRVRNVGTLGGNLCFAEPHSDPGALLMAWNATVVLGRSEGERRVRMEEFFTGILQTARQPDEVLLRVEVPLFEPDQIGAYEKLTFYERPTASVAAIVKVREGHIAEARVVVGSVGPVPMRMRDAEELLRGREPVPAVVEAAARAAARHAEVLEDLYGSAEYKRHLIHALTRRVLSQLFELDGTPVG
jgi:carbon-monoxide dehydrogenase medium subunit